MINFDPNSLNNVFDKNFGAGAYNSGLSNARKAAQLKTQAGFAKSEFLKALSAYQAKQKKDLEYMDKYGMTYDQYQAKKEQDKLNKLQDKYQVLDNGLTSDQASKMRSKAEAQGRGGHQPSYAQQRKEAQKSSKEKGKSPYTKEQSTLSDDLSPYAQVKLGQTTWDQLYPKKSSSAKKKENKKSSPSFLSKIGNGIKGIGSEIWDAGVAAEQFVNPFDKVSADQAVKNYMNRKPSKAKLEVERGANRAVDSASLGLMSNLDKKVNKRDPYYNSHRAFGQGGGTDTITSGLGYLVPGIGATKLVRGLGLGAKEATGLAKYGQLAKEGAITGGALMGAEQTGNWALNPQDQSIGNSLFNVGLGLGLGAVGDPLLHGIGQGAMNGLSRFAKGEVPTFTGKPSQSVTDSLIPKSKSPGLNSFNELNQNPFKANDSNLPLNPAKGIENIKPFDRFQPKQPPQPRPDIANSPLLMSLNPAKTAEKLNPKPDLTPSEQELQSEFQNAVKQQVDYLKNSMGKGVDRGTTSNGLDGNFKEVTGTFNVSRNPKWYQDFYKATGRKPNNAELEQLAKEHVLGGFQDEFGNIPAFVPKKLQNIYDQMDEISTIIKEQPEQGPILQPILQALDQEKSMAEEEYNQFLMKLNLQQFGKNEAKDPKQLNLLSRTTLKEVTVPKVKAKQQAKPQAKEPPKPVPGEPVPKDFDAAEHIGGLINREARQKAKPTGKEKIKTMMDNTYIKMVDDFYGGTKLDKAAGKDITSQESATVNAHIAKGSGEKARQELERGYFDETGKKIGKSFNEIIQSSKDPDALERYLVARSILDYDEKGMKAIKTGGLNQRQIAEKAIRDIEKQYPGVKDEAKDMYTFIKNQRDILKEGEMLNESQMKVMDKANKNYVPMERVHEDGIESFVNANETMKKRYANVGDPMKKRTGSERDIISPLQTLVKRQYIYNNMAERNKVGAAVLNNLTALGKDNPFASIVGVEKNGAYKLADAAGELAGKTEKEIPESINSLFQDADGKNNIVYVYKGGDKYKIQIKDKFLYESMMSLNVKQLPGWMKVLNYPTQILRAGVTLSPDFGLRNIFRDQLTTAVTSKVGYKPFYDALKGASEIIKARKGKSPIVESYIRNGGSMSVLQNIDRTNIVKSYQDLVGNKTTREKLIGIAKDPLKWLEPMRKLGEFSEMSTRIGHYKRALNKGMSPKDATYLARSTMDFNRAGTWGRQINQGVAFFNASIQGLDVLARSIKDRPAETFKNIGLYVALPTAALYMMNKDQDWYKEIPADARDRNWYIPVGGQIIQLPKPFEVGILFGAGLERTLDKAFNEQNSPYKDFAKEIAKTMTPDVIPTAVKPLVEVVTNHDFFTGQSIESLGDQSLNPADRYNAYNSQFAINTAKGLAALNPKSKVSPKQIDHLVRGYTGTLGSYATEGIDKVSEAVNPNVPKKPTRGVQTAPFIRSFFVKNLEGNNRSVGDFYDSFDKFRQMKKSMENNGQTFPYVAQKKAVERTMSAINKLQKSKKEVLNSNKISAKDKAEQIKQLNQRITALAKQGNSYTVK